MGRTQPGGSMKTRAAVLRKGGEPWEITELGPDARYPRPGARRTPGRDRPDLSLTIRAGEVAMARRTSPPFRADHVGSLLRPQRLLQARDDFAAGRITAADLRSVEDQEIPKAVRMQEEVGLQSATDGEFRRTTWHM